MCTREQSWLGRAVEGREAKRGAAGITRQGNPPLPDVDTQHNKGTPPSPDVDTQHNKGIPPSPDVDTQHNKGTPPSPDVDCVFKGKVGV